ncbi:MAG TPA: leucine--tRNA ligase [Candidatus Faecalibacterium avium]|uniref:leucine--tRNA ligase n=1 Tax=Faecalibacterium sp. An58 TaxID=1965648 RepID=UPI000B3705DF|nr:leucine--tRNA ligase [Faecalibacterium sp. An58]OUN74166.1 leucine--tRNA ligase [Faecalibacterium sp. An58]HIV43673.1 leucine--tRNA ligase [Candidatus Faecalibacterium avium]
MKYDFKAVEAKWQKVWEDEKTFHAEIDPQKPKFYALVEFPYPSAAGLHVGHPRSYTALDVVARRRRQCGYNVLYPMGWDAFGLPTENYAMKNHIHPAIVTKKNVDRFRAQLKSLGFSFDWDREINTTDPEYYKWTQWIFLQLYKHGLAYKKEMNVNWCTGCKCVLANEEVVNGVCERCGSEVVHRVKSQWMLKITDYADKLIDGLDGLDYIDRVVTQQKNWIGRSYGAEIDFGTTTGDTLTVYTTRCDTLFGATYMVLSPENSLLARWMEEGVIRNADEVKAYQAEAARKSDFERTEINKEKTGVRLDGVMGINPVNGKQIPIFISDYVLATYGTGAIMAVPAHDSRDWEFAKKFGLPIVEVVKGKTPSDLDKEAFTDVATGTLVNSGFLDGLSVTDAKEKMAAWLEENGKGHKKVNYKLRDWVFSRQRYWGEPIPMVKCDKCGWQPLPESSLPLTLPDIVDFEPGPDGESPLARHTDWVKTTCPCCGGPAVRETDTMPQWAGSSWYFLRYMDPHNQDALASKEALEYWSPVDWYNGGMEHTTLHLLYSRFWHKFLYDIGVVPTAEPYQKRTSHGMILGLNPHNFANLPADEQKALLEQYGNQKAAERALEEKYGEMARHPVVKMSKSLGNVVNPDDVVAAYGADTMRLYEMFMGDFEQAAPWQTSAIAGCNRFLDRVWGLSEKLVEGEGYRPAIETLMHQTIKKVGADIEGLKMNTAIAQLMTLVNALYDNGGATRAEFETLVQLLNPFAPHMTEELWEKLGHTHDQQLAYYPWPAYDEAKCVEATVEIAVQVNGKVKARLTVPADITADDAIAQAKAEPAVAAALAGKTLVKEIYVKGRLVNLAAKG